MGVESKVLQKSEGTALYDSMVELGATFARASHPDAIGVVVVVTDGKDEHSKQFPNDPVTAGATYRYLMSRGRSRHLTVLIGVGSNREIDHTALTRLADHGGMQLVTVDNMGKLGDVLASIGTQLVSGVVTDVFDFGPIAAVRQRTETRLKVIPFDYVILMDRSGSMANRG